MTRSQWWYLQRLKSYFTGPPGNLLNRWAAIFTIIFGLISAVLSGWAIKITQDAENKAQRIDSLSIVIEQLKQQNTNQNLQLKELSNITQQNQQVNEKLANLLSSYSEQNKIFRTNSIPSIVLKADSIRIDTSEVITLYVPFQNIGNRTAKNLSATVTYIEELGPRLEVFANDNVFIEKEFFAKAFNYLMIPIKEVARRGVLVINFKYDDELDNQTHNTLYKFVLIFEDLKLKSRWALPERHERKLNDFLKNKHL